LPARDLLLFAGLKQKPISRVRTDGRVAEVVWSTAGGIKIELYELEENSQYRNDPSVPDVQNWRFST
jgi:hypothetical protein